MEPQPAGWAGPRRSRTPRSPSPATSPPSSTASCWTSTAVAPPWPSSPDSPGSLLDSQAKTLRGDGTQLVPPQGRGGRLVQDPGHRHHRLSHKAPSTSPLHLPRPIAAARNLEGRLRQAAPASQGQILYRPQKVHSCGGRVVIHAARLASPGAAPSCLTEGRGGLRVAVTA